MDMGKSLTHKRLALHNHKKKDSHFKECAFERSYSESVDRYIKDGTRIENSMQIGIMNRIWHFLQDS